MEGKKQIKNLVADTLGAIELDHGCSVNLVFGTGYQESHYEYIRQIGGPALSYWQIEPNTYKDICNRINRNVVLYKKCLNVLNMAYFPFNPEVLVGNMQLAIIICRLKYYLDPSPLPNDDEYSLSAYYKRIYNTALGAASLNQATANFKIAIQI